MSLKKRFIAGAVCPQCSATDTIQTYRDGETDFRECVECGFKDEMRFKPLARELTTRITPPSEEAVQAVRIVDLPAPKPGGDPSGT